MRAAGLDQLARSDASAYGTSFPLETKGVRAAGWYFSSDNAFDLATAYALEPSEALLAGLIANLDYEAGSNPVNVSFVTGLGWKQQREIVHQWAQNDRRTLPPSGIPPGNVQSGFSYLGPYAGDLGKMSFPTDDTSGVVPFFPLYDRWGDSFNVTTEFVVSNQGRALGASALWMALSAVKDQPWISGQATIEGVPGTVGVGAELTATLSGGGLDLGRARIFWDGEGLEPAHGPQFRFKPTVFGPQTLEAEAYWPDGRRVHAAFSFTATTPAQSGKPELTVASTANGSEAGLVNGSVTFTRSGDLTAPLVVRYSLFGSAAYNGDYDAVNGNYWYQGINTLTFDAGSATAVIVLRTLQDDFKEPAEEVIATLLVDSGYTIGAAGRAVVTITDDD